MQPAMPLDLLAYDPGRACYRPYQRYSDERSGRGESLYRQGGQEDTTDEAIAARLGLPLGPAMVDKALSGFRGDNLLRGAISGYLQQVRARRVPQGDVIGLDEWSRLTRLPLDESSHLLTGIISAGVGIYVRRTGTLISRAVVNGHSGFMDLAMALMHLKLAHQESENKSRYNRITIAKRHADAEARGVIRSKLTPAWLEVTGGTFKEPGPNGRAIVQRPGPLNVIKRVFKEIRRHGIAQISEGLNRDWQAGEEWCAPFGLVTKRKNGSSGWHPASVSALLHDIRVMGLVQRTVTDQRTGEKRKEGEPYRHPLHEAAPAWVRTACVSSDALARSVDRCLGVETRLAPARHPETSNRWSGRPHDTMHHRQQPWSRMVGDARARECVGRRRRKPTNGLEPAFTTALRTLLALGWEGISHTVRGARPCSPPRHPPRRPKASWRCSTTSAPTPCGRAAATPQRAMSDC